MNNFITALDRIIVAFNRLFTTLLSVLSKAKLKGGIFIELQIENIFMDLIFVNSLTKSEKTVWNSLRFVILELVGNKYRQLVADL